MTIHDKLINLRKEHYLSVRDLAAEIGVPHASYFRLERSQVPNLAILSKLAAFYGYTLSGLLKDVDTILD